MQARRTHTLIDSRHGSLLLGFFFLPVFTATLTISLHVERGVFTAAIE